MLARGCIPDCEQPYIFSVAKIDRAAGCVSIPSSERCPEAIQRHAITAWRIARRNLFDELRCCKWSPRSC